jgi:hypothetical protein
MAGFRDFDLRGILLALLILAVSGGLGFLLGLWIGS